jgi:hypothetical protein
VFSDIQALRCIRGLSKDLLPRIIQPFDLQPLQPRASAPGTLKICIQSSNEFFSVWPEARWDVDKSMISAIASNRRIG